MFQSKVECPLPWLHISSIHWTRSTVSIVLHPRIQFSRAPTVKMEKLLGNSSQTKCLFHTFPRLLSCSPSIIYRRSPDRDSEWLKPTESHYGVIRGGLWERRSLKFTSLYFLGHPLFWVILFLPSLCNRTCSTSLPIFISTWEGFPYNINWQRSYILY